ncbi:Hypothetical protein AA314_06852 [Archangium gephyra]|uniref:Uncharacterized protein n=1 Tax=Archangium gephyra TaxID=48 RepID=A0AAC8QDP6_9BACT|nr:Hypothetical protein AA314_06852 [Archangium gephyra]
MRELQRIERDACLTVRGRQEGIQAGAQALSVSRAQSCRSSSSRGHGSDTP